MCWLQYMGVDWHYFNMVFNHLIKNQSTSPVHDELDLIKQVL